jgi:hypothetical protein
MAAVDAALDGRAAPQDRVDAFLATRSWDRTWAAMARLLDERDRKPAPDREHRVASRPATARLRERRTSPTPVRAFAGGASSPRVSAFRAEVD